MRKYSIQIAGIIFFVFYLLSYLSFQNIRIDSKNKGYKSNSFNIPPLALKIIAGEFKGLFADYALIEAASIVGQAEKITEDQWDTIEHLYKQTIALDPYFEQSCYLIQGTLPWLAKRYEPTFALLNECKNHRYWDWHPGFFIGFDYFFFLKDNNKASEYLMGASTVYNAPPPLVTFAARLAQESGNNKTAIAFIELMLPKENDPDKRELLLKRLETHKAVDSIETAIQAYRQKVGRNPETLNALVEEGYMTNLPSNPNEKPFIYKSDDGSLRF